jgi:hypothetical protein
LLSERHIVPGLGVQVFEDFARDYHLAALASRPIRSSVAAVVSWKVLGLVRRFAPKPEILLRTPKTGIATS